MDDRRRSSARRLGWLLSGLIAVACVACGFLARLALDPFVTGQAPFVTFFPAVIAAGLLGGAASGAFAVLLATPLVVLAEAQHPIITSTLWVVMASIVAVSAGSVRDLSRRLRAERDELARTQARLELVLREQVHRAKNTMAVLTALANQTAQGASSVEDFRDRLTERIRALSSAYAMLTERGHDAPLDLAEIVETALAPYRSRQGERLTILAGPSAKVAPSIGLPLTLCLNELATNAVKYGALDPRGRGRAECDWIEASPGVFVVRWRERDGPSVAPPAASGLGMRMIRAAFADIPGGSADLRFIETGVECDLAFDAAADLS